MTKNNVSKNMYYELVVVWKFLPLCSKLSIEFESTDLEYCNANWQTNFMSTEPNLNNINLTFYAFVFLFN